MFTRENAGENGRWLQDDAEGQRRGEWLRLICNCSSRILSVLRICEELQVRKAEGDSKASTEDTKTSLQLKFLQCSQTRSLRCCFDERLHCSRRHSPTKTSRRRLSKNCPTSLGVKCGFDLLIGYSGHVPLVIGPLVSPFPAPPSALVTIGAFMISQKEVFWEGRSYF